MKTKICPKCEKEKTVSKKNFYYSEKRKLFDTSSCKECRKEALKKSYKQDPKYKVQAMARTEKYREQNREFVLDYLKKNPCVDCKESDIIVLAFDHIDPKTKKKAVSILIRNYHPDVVKAEIEKCEVRCANCHIRKTTKQFNWWKNGK